MKKCADVIVTYNRKALLRENIEALTNQSYKKHDILIVDNASTDGTKEMIEKLGVNNLKYYNTGKNLGGAGGFAYGMKIAMEGGYDYAWIMDDDSVPDKNALESLVNKAEIINDEFSFFASLVYWTDKKVFPMNYPRTDYKHIQETCCNYLYEYRLIPITGCSFVGCFVNLEVGRKVGLPIAEFFIYGDDVEYTHRLKREKPAYLDLDSTIEHKAPSNSGADIVTADAGRISRFYHQSRNGMYNARKEKAVFRRILIVFQRLFRIIAKSRDHKLKRIGVLIRGTFAGFFFNPKIRFPEVK